jgi:formylglycine-generating enzyme required for sulfatase activity
MIEQNCTPVWQNDGGDWDYTGRLPVSDERIGVAQPNLARIAAGVFLMGSAEGKLDERPIHQVYLSEFFIGRYAVTHDEYARFVNATGHRAPAIQQLPLIASGRDNLFKELAAPYVWDRRGPPAGRGGHPVVLIGYGDAVAYCGWLSKVLARTVRLPTEAEWEKAARGGVDAQRFPWGDGELDASRCNFLTDPPRKAQRGTRATGTYSPNGYGLYDVAGNVWEWVSDWYSSNYYATVEARDPQGPESGETRIVRGGSWVSEDPSMFRCAYRHEVPPDTYAYSIGFRIVCAP